jgi:hypothetical protein
MVGLKDPFTIKAKKSKDITVMNGLKNNKRNI